MPYYFDTLPLHPQPERLETFTSYLLRLAQAHHIRTVDKFSALCFPGHNRRVVRELSDYPPVSFAALPTLAVCPIPALLATTFHHVGIKFGRSTRPQPLSRFLGKNVAPYLRYCPACIAEHRYYHLTWRFTMLSGCIQHRCRFLESCGHCGHPIPLFSAPLQIGVCANCRADLRTCQTESLDRGEWRITLSRYYDLAFLAAPGPAGGDQNDWARFIGRRFVYQRRSGGLLARDVADLLGTTLTEVEGIERGNALGRGAAFDSYVRYATRLGMTLRSMFTTVLVPEQRAALRNEDNWYGGPLPS